MGLSSSFVVALKLRLNKALLELPLYIRVLLTAYVNDRVGRSRKNVRLLRPLGRKSVSQGLLRRRRYRDEA